MPDAPVWHRCSQTLRFCDTDSVGHINNSVYSVMFEAGRVELLNATGVLDRAGPFAPVLVRLEIDFRREMSFPGTVLIESAVSRIGSKSIHIPQRVFKDGELRAEGVSVLAILDKATRRAVPLDERWRQGFAPWTLAAT